MEFVHRSVLLLPTVEALAVRPDGIYLDGTLGGAGHSYEIASRLTTGASSAWTGRDGAGRRRGASGSLCRPRHPRPQQFRRSGPGSRFIGHSRRGRMLFDLGVSSPQLDDAERGLFLYAGRAPGYADGTAPPA